MHSKISDTFPSIPGGTPYWPQHAYCNHDCEWDESARNQSIYLAGAMLHMHALGKAQKPVYLLSWSNAAHACIRYGTETSLFT